MFQMHNKKTSNTLVNIAISTGLILLSHLCLALPDDSTQEINIASDSALLDKLAGQVIYTGNVKMQQGSLKIDADKITILRGADGLEKVIAHGQPAKYEQLINLPDGKTHAYGDTIIYHTLAQQVTLLKNAGLEKEGNVFAGDKIVYLIKEQRVKAESPEPQERIRMVIQPKKDQTEQ